jgi:crotonobetainyl-CoA:carnitine CoA-transferase CaiB-like acyl-CoA transferase
MMSRNGMAGTGPDVGAVVRRVWTSLGLDPAALAQLDLPGTQPALPSSFAVSHAAQAGIALAALAAAEVWHQRSGRRQRVSVDLRHAAIEARSDHYFAIDGREVRVGDPLTGLYRCGDGGWVRIHANFAHHRDGALALLGCAASREAITAALRSQSALAFEEAASASGLPVVALRSTAEWEAHAQGRAVAALPLLSVSRLGDAPARLLRGSGAGVAADAPLAGIRVLDLTRILAGPVAGRTLAAHGADVLLVNSPSLPNIEAVPDVNRGKLSAHLDLRDNAGKATMESLLETTDVFLQGYRPGSLAALGLGPQALAERHPGIVYASLSAWGPDGPWRLRRGFDSLVQTAAGFNLDEAEAAGSSTPKPLPTQILDHAAGYLLAFGIAAALLRRAREGGSWHVQVSLAQTAAWLRSLGRIAHGFDVPDPGRDDVRDLLETTPSGFGELTAVRHAARMTETPPGWRRPAVPLGANPPRWPDV